MPNLSYQQILSPFKEIKKKGYTIMEVRGLEDRDLKKNYKPKETSNPKKEEEKLPKASNDSKRDLEKNCKVQESPALKEKTELV